MSGYNLKDIIGINQSVGEQGLLQNQGSLEFALSMARQRTSWLYELAYCVRSLLVDHAFVDGNKRTALTLIVLFAEDNGYRLDPAKATDAVVRISRKNHKDINRIVRLLKPCLTRNG